MNHPNSVPDRFAPIYSLVAQRLGMRVRELDAQKLSEFASQRLTQLRCSLDDYLERLRKSSSTDSSEWQEVAQCVTNNESFFFRDEGLYTLLQSKLLPELLEKNRSQKRLRIWSAASSRGEEIYSIAILLNEMADQLPGWTLQIFGSDINEKVLKTAREGIYSEWSLRAISQDRRERYFKRTQAGWCLSSDIKKMVEFKHLNLVGDSYPKGRDWLQGIDLILCRNVFIYFSQEAIQSTVQKLSNCLSQEGVLVTGHAELNEVAATGLAREVLPGSLIYRKGGPAQPEPLMLVQLELPRTKPRLDLPSRNRPMRKAVSASPVDSKTTLSAKTVETDKQPARLEQVLALFKSCRYKDALQRLSQIEPVDNLEKLNLLKIETQSLTNLGEYPAALEAAKMALDLSPFSAELYYLKAYILELMDDKKAAASALEKSIYLDGEFIPAYIELSTLLDMSNREGRARQLRKTAVNLLSLRPIDAEVFPYAGMTAGELGNLLTDMIGGE